MLEPAPSVVAVPLAPHDKMLMCARRHSMCPKVLGHFKRLGADLMGLAVAYIMPTAQPPSLALWPGRMAPSADTICWGDELVLICIARLPISKNAHVGDLVHKLLDVVMAHVCRVCQMLSGHINDCCCCC
jgi:hypothetical protein